MKSFVLSMAGALLILTAVPKREHARQQPTSTQEQTNQETKTFSGTILKKGDKFVLSDSVNKISYVLDDAKTASPFVGKKVKVTGTVDISSNTIHVEKIEEVV